MEAAKEDISYKKLFAFIGPDRAKQPRYCPVSHGKDAGVGQVRMWPHVKGQGAGDQKVGGIQGRMERAAKARLGD